MNRYAEPSREQLKARLKTLKQELLDAEDALSKAIDSDSLKDYKKAHTVMQCAEQDIEDTIKKLYPLQPRSWFDKYGDLILPKAPKIKGSPNYGIIEDEND